MGESPRIGSGSPKRPPVPSSNLGGLKQTTSTSENQKVSPDTKTKSGVKRPPTTSDDYRTTSSTVEPNKLDLGSLPSEVKTQKPKRGQAKVPLLKLGGTDKTESKVPLLKLGGTDKTESKVPQLKLGGTDKTESKVPQLKLGGTDKTESKVPQLKLGGTDKTQTTSTTQTTKKPAPIRQRKIDDRLRFGGQKYKVSKQLGEGSYGKAFLLQNRGDGPNMVLKQANPRIVYNRVKDFGVTEQGSEDLVRKWSRREVNLQNKVAQGGQPNFVPAKRIKGGGVAMDYVGGGDLRKTFEGLEEMRSKRQINDEKYWGTVQYLSKELTNGVKHLRERGIVHRDLNPGNILLDPVSLHPKIVDFGIAKRVKEHDFTLSDKLYLGSGTPGYTAPETMLATAGATYPKSTNRSDVYSLGKMVEDFGKSGAKPPKEFTDFVLKLTDNDRSKRLRPGTALKHAFLAKPKISKSEAKEVLSLMLKSRST
jgi:tRNA A-37 threonylcarbamoyl transferase component Bud32